MLSALVQMLFQMNRKILLLSIPLLFATACEKEETTVVQVPGGPSVDPPYSMLHYDASNMDAPLLGAGTFEGAARFDDSQINAFVGADITKVWYYLKNLPQSCELRIYQADAGSSAPDSLLYSADVSGDMEAGRWNDHTLASPLEIPDRDIWISIRFVHSSDTRSLGCDPGPAVDNGDKMWTAAGGQWITLRQYNGTNINWNIRTVILP